MKLYRCFTFFIAFFCILSSAHISFATIQEEEATQENFKNILSQFTENSRFISSIYAEFTQEKFLDFLDFPMETSGTLFFEKEPNMLLFWEYNAPSLSGIWIENEKQLLWTQTRHNAHPPQAKEKQFTTVMAEELLFWLDLNPQIIEEQYAITLIAPYTLRLVPKKKSFFYAIEMSISQEVKTLEELIFYESKQNYTRIQFHNIKLNTSKESVFPTGTAF